MKNETKPEYNYMYASYTYDLIHRLRVLVYHV